MKLLKGVWHSSEKGIEDVVHGYFSKICQGVEPDYEHMHSIVDLTKPTVTNAMNADLCAPYKALEIWYALFQMYPTKSPRPDEMSPLFFQKYFLHTGQLLPEINFTNVCLIPKVKNPVNMSDLRPTALCNVLYKICAKVVANRLKKSLLKIIPPFQSAFILG